ncbi:hypothetical protein FZEAL_6321 [Fusarium zealandicum]|uniref:F-box domain-containing protein n=1 Tax=Fusarium zealandicum TaxID=1053134 RepID=A0A8H4UI08_9HYPO|nr:hypothetical protein FZEAL_6321 [Fusarium zealandicum]
MSDPIDERDEVLNQEPESPDSPLRRSKSMDALADAAGLKEPGVRTITSTLLTLPPELIDNILSHLSPWDLTAVSATCKTLRRHALSDVLWHPLVQENVPGVTLTSPAPCSNYRELYAAHDRFWFLPRHKIWFCDHGLAGKLIIVRYDPRRGCIEGYRLLAWSDMSVHAWPGRPQIQIHDFNPEVKLHLDKPELQFRIGEDRIRNTFLSLPGYNPFAQDIPMMLEDRLEGSFTNFVLARPLSTEAVEANLNPAADFPYGSIWPPPAIPSDQHVAGSEDLNIRLMGRPVNGLSSSIEQPQRRAEVSDNTFRLRHWIERGRTFTGLVERFQPPRHQHVGAFYSSEELFTFSTLDAKLYTPTPLKPWRGIWVGDYSTHGAEFLLVHQPDDHPATDEDLGIVRQTDETGEDWNKRRDEARTHRGRLEAIKLTGDPNVPRGEHTFIVDDLGPDGLVRIADDPLFSGVRIVRSRGHVADAGFVQDTYIDSQLLLLSHNRLAQYWVEFGHVSYFERVDIDRFLKI